MASGKENTLDGVKRGLTFSSPSKASERYGMFPQALSPSEETAESVEELRHQMFTMTFSPPGKSESGSSVGSRKPLGERRVGFAAGTNEGGRASSRPKRQCTPRRASVAEEKDDEEEEEEPSKAVTPVSEQRRRAERYAFVAASAASVCESPAPSKLLPQREALTPRDADAREYKRHVAALRLQALLHRRRAVRAFTKTAKMAREQREQRRVQRGLSSVSTLTTFSTLSSPPPPPLSLEEATQNRGPPPFSEEEDLGDSKEAFVLREALRRASEENARLEAKLSAALGDVEKLHQEHLTHREEEEQRLLLEEKRDLALVEKSEAALERKRRDEDEVLELRARVAEEKAVALELDLKKFEAEAAARAELAEAKLLSEVAALKSTTDVQDEFLREAQKMAVDAEDRARAACAAAAAASASLRLSRSELDRDRASWDALRRSLHNQVVELRGNVRTFVRVRPAGADAESVIVCNSTSRQNNKGSSSLSSSSSSSSSSGGGDVVEVPEAVASGGPPRQRRTHQFAVDRAFSPSADQAQVFAAVEPFVQSAIDGYQVCVFAYGQTGSGKTHTVVGEPNGPGRGLLGRALDLIFREIDDLSQHRGWTFEAVSLQAYEIYLDKVYDLLDDSVSSSSAQQHHNKVNNRRSSSMFLGGGASSIDVKDKALEVVATGGDVYVKGLSEVTATTDAKAASILNAATRRRRTSATKSNAKSSRSHCVFSMSFKGSHPAFGDRSGKLNLVDLAGSERLKASGSADDPNLLREAQHINTSLAALGNTIAALARNSNSKKTQADHVPYRDSKLTHLLQNSLGGEGKTLAIFNVAPEDTHHRESINTLRFAQKVSKCVLGPGPACQTSKANGLCPKCAAAAAKQAPLVA